MQFTGHERDLNAQTGTNPSADDLDYMHARFFNPVPARFLSPDKRLNAFGTMKHPQLWNRYSYALGSPIGLKDPDGREVIVPSWMQPAITEGLKKSPEFKRLYERLAEDNRVHAKFNLNAQKRTGSRIGTDMKISHSGSEVVKVDATIVVPVGSADKVPEVGHEFKHVEEILDTGKTLEERYRDHDESVKRNATGYESDAALATEEEIRTQMSVWSLPPGAIGFIGEPDVLYSGPLFIEGIYLNLSEAR
jgi:RHS repeat-associated protein